MINASIQAICIHCTLNTKAPSQPNVSSHTLRHTCQYSHLHQRKCLERKQQQNKSVLLANASCFSLQRGRPQVQQNAPELFRAWSESDRRSLSCSHWQWVPALHSFKSLLAGAGSLSARAGSCRMQKLLKRGHCSQLLRGTLQVLQHCRILAGPTHPNPSSKHRHSLGAALPKVFRNTSFLWTLLMQFPSGITCAKEIVFSKPVGQGFFSGAPDLVVPVRQLGYSLPSPAGSTFPAELLW